MQIRQRITDVMNAAIADIFMLDVDHISSHPEFDFRADLHASSIQYFPLIARIEDEFDIVIDSYAFQKRAHTIEDAISLVTKQFIEQKEN